MLEIFWNYNSYFQKILIAVNQIIHDVNYNHDHYHVHYIYLDIYRLGTVIIQEILINYMRNQKMYMIYITCLLI